MTGPEKASTGPIRTFIAIELPPDCREALRRVEEDLKGTVADVRWVVPENVHLTLHFLGDVPTEGMEEVRSALAGACAECQPFPLELHGLGAFPNLRRPRAVWAGFAADTTPARALADSVARAMAGQGYPADKPFRPHVTLGRVRSDRGMRALTGALARLKDEPLGAFVVEAVTLFRSDLLPTGPRYTALAQIRLDGG